MTSSKPVTAGLIAAHVPWSTHPSEDGVWVRGAVNPPPLSLTHTLDPEIPNSGVYPTINPLTSSKALWKVPFTEYLWPQPRLFSMDQQGRPLG